MASWAGSTRLSCGISGGMIGPPETALVMVAMADVKEVVDLVANVGTVGVALGVVPSGSAAGQMHVCYI